MSGTESVSESSVPSFDGEDDYSDMDEVSAAFTQTPSFFSDNSKQEQQQHRKEDDTLLFRAENEDDEDNDGDYEDEDGDNDPDDQDSRENSQEASSWEEGDESNSSDNSPKQKHSMTVQALRFPADPTPITQEDESTFFQNSYQLENVNVQMDDDDDKNNNTGEPSEHSDQDETSRKSGDFSYDNDDGDHDDHTNSQSEGSYRSGSQLQVEDDDEDEDMRVAAHEEMVKRSHAYVNDDDGHDDEDHDEEYDDEDHDEEYNNEGHYEDHDDYPRYTVQDDASENDGSSSGSSRSSASLRSDGISMESSEVVNKTYPPSIMMDTTTANNGSATIDDFCPVEPQTHNGFFQSSFSASSHGSSGNAIPKRSKSDFRNSISKRSESHRSRTTAAAAAAHNNNKSGSSLDSYDTMDGAKSKSTASSSTPEFHNSTYSAPNEDHDLEHKRKSAWEEDNASFQTFETTGSIQQNVVISADFSGFDTKTKPPCDIIPSNDEISSNNKDAANSGNRLGSPILYDSPSDGTNLLDQTSENGAGVVNPRQVSSTDATSGQHSVVTSYEDELSVAETSGGWTDTNENTNSDIGLNDSEDDLLPEPGYRAVSSSLSNGMKQQQQATAQHPEIFTDVSDRSDFNGKNLLNISDEHFSRQMPNEHSREIPDDDFFAEQSGIDSISNSRHNASLLPHSVPAKQFSSRDILEAGHENESLEVGCVDVPSDRIKSISGHVNGFDRVLDSSIDISNQDSEMVVSQNLDVHNNANDDSPEPADYLIMSVQHREGLESEENALPSIFNGPFDSKESTAFEFVNDAAMQRENVTMGSRISRTEAHDVTNDGKEEDSVDDSVSENEYENNIDRDRIEYADIYEDFGIKHQVNGDDAPVGITDQRDGYDDFVKTSEKALHGQSPIIQSNYVDDLSSKDATDSPRDDSSTRDRSEKCSLGDNANKDVEAADNDQLSFDSHLDVDESENASTDNQSENVRSDDQEGDVAGEDNDQLSYNSQLDVGEGKNKSSESESNGSSVHDGDHSSARKTEADIVDKEKQADDVAQVFRDKLTDSHVQGFPARSMDCNNLGESVEESHNFRNGDESAQIARGTGGISHSSHTKAEERTMSDVDDESSNDRGCIAFDIIAVEKNERVDDEYGEQENSEEQSDLSDNLRDDVGYDNDNEEQDHEGEEHDEQNSQIGSDHPSGRYSNDSFSTAEIDQMKAENSASIFEKDQYRTGSHDVSDQLTANEDVADGENEGDFVDADFAECDNIGGFHQQVDNPVDHLPTNSHHDVNVEEKRKAAETIVDKSYKSVTDDQVDAYLKYKSVLLASIEDTDMKVSKQIDESGIANVPLGNQGNRGDSQKTPFEPPVQHLSCSAELNGRKSNEDDDFLHCDTSEITMSLASHGDTRENWIPSHDVECIPPEPAISTFSRNDLGLNDPDCKLLSALVSTKESSSPMLQQPMLQQSTRTGKSDGWTDSEMSALTGQSKQKLLFLKNGIPPYTSDDVEEDVESGSRDDDSREPILKVKEKRKTYMFAGLLFVVLILLVLVFSLYLKEVLNNNEETLSAPPAPTPSFPQIPVPTITQQPTYFSTSVPSTFLLQWDLVATINGSMESALGASIAVNEDMIVVGEPLSGTVRTFIATSPNGTEWFEENTTVTDIADSFFGSSVDLADDRMVVGAPYLHAEGTEIAVGGAYFYIYTSLSKSWQQLGTPLHGDDDIAVAGGEEFGSAVSVSNAFRAVVGAPSNNLLAGRVYTFDYNEALRTWDSGSLFPLVGEKAGDRFGFSLSMSKDGSRFISGAPGNGPGTGTGYIYMYSWLGSYWQRRDVLRGQSDNEAFGSSVSVLSDTGDCIAIGAPGFQNGAGRILVYQQEPTTGEYTQLGSDVVGEPGESLGLSGSLSGFTGRTGPSVAVSTGNGYVKRFDYDAVSRQWTQRFSVLTDPGGGNSALSFSTDGQADTLAIGSGVISQLTIYEAESLVNVSVSTSSPIPSTMTAAPSGVVPITSSPTQSFLNASTPTVSPSFVATPSITSLPSTSPPLATVPVTAIPTVSNNAWIKSGGPFSNGQVGTGFGNAVGLSDTYMATGASTEKDVGVVWMFTMVDATAWAATSSQQIEGTQSGGLFGAALDIKGDVLLVGAPGMFADGTATPTGAALYYSLTNGVWNQYGSILRGDAGVYGADESFGQSVGVSLTQRMVIGAPGSSVDVVIQRGRVYIYEYVTEIADWMLIEDILGTVSGEAFGSAVDISSSGNFVIVGAPGNEPGYATVYQYNAFSWLSVATFTGEGADAMGSSVQVLDSEGFIVAVGAPGFDNGRGRVLVYERDALTRSYIAVGAAIVGEIGERIGAANRIAGEVLDDSTIRVMTGTAFGQVKRWQWNSATAMWEQTISHISTGYQSGLASISCTQFTDTCVAGGSDSSAIFDAIL